MNGPPGPGDSVPPPQNDAPPPHAAPQNAFFFDEDTIELICNDDGFLHVHLAAIIIALIIGTTILIHGIISFRHKKFSKISKVFRYLFISCGVSFILSNLFFIVVYIDCTLKANVTIAIYNYSISVFFYDAELISLILLLLARLHYTFSHGAFPLSRKRIIFIFICILIIFALHITSIVILCIDLNLIIQAFIISLVAIIWYFILSWMLVYMFVKRLEFLAVVTAQSLYTRTRDNTIRSQQNSGDTVTIESQTDTNTETNKSSTKISMNIARSLKNNLRNGLKKQHRYKKLINSASKYVALSTIAFSTTLFCGIVRGAGAMIGEGENGAAIGILLQIIDSITNMICLWLSYSFSMKYYDKYCLQLDDCCTSCVLRCTSQKIVKKYAKELNDGTRNLDGLGNSKSELELESKSEIPNATPQSKI
eukprot:174184_1